MKQEIFDYNSIEYTIYIGQNKFENFDLIDETIPTDIMSVDNLIGRLVLNSDKIKTEFLEGPYEKGKTTYYRGSWFSLINGEDNFYERFEKAFKHLATFCEKKIETF